MRHTFGVFNGCFFETTGGNKHAFIGLLTSQSPNKTLNLFTAYGRCPLMSLRLNINYIKTQTIFIYYSIDTFIVRLPGNLRSLPLKPPYPMLTNNIKFEELFSGTIDQASAHTREVVKRACDVQDLQVSRRPWMAESDHHNDAVVIFAYMDVGKGREQDAEALLTIIHQALQTQAVPTSHSQSAWWPLWI